MPKCTQQHGGLCKMAVGHLKTVTMVTAGDKNIIKVFFNYNQSILTFREKFIVIYWNLKKIGLKGLCHLNIMCILHIFTERKMHYVKTF